MNVLPRVLCVSVLSLAGASMPAAQTTPVTATPPPTPQGEGARGAGAAAAAQGPGRGGFAPVVIGPAAPVPPEVAIPRPTAEELAQVNAAVRKFIDSDTSTAKPLLKKFESLLLLQPRATATWPQPSRRRFSGRGRGTTASSRSPSRGTSICCCTATRSPTGGCRTTPTRRCSKSTSAACAPPTSRLPATRRRACCGG